MDEGIAFLPAAQGNIVQIASAAFGLPIAFDAHAKRRGMMGETDGGIAGGLRLGYDLYAKGHAGHLLKIREDFLAGGAIEHGHIFAQVV